MIKNLGFLMTLLLVSCANLSNQKREVGPQFNISQELFNELSTSPQRKIASSTQEVSEQMLKDLEKSMNPQRIYFRSIYQQFLELKKLSFHSSSLNSCPQFHHDKVEVDQSVKLNQSKIQFKNLNNLPEVYFPEKTLVKFGLEDYITSLDLEIGEICERGYSNNSYKFENFITYYAHKNDYMKSQEAFVAMLKIPVYKNLLVLKSIDEKLSPIDMALINEGGERFLNYIVKVRQIRSNYLKPNLVTFKGNP